MAKRKRKTRKSKQKPAEGVFVSLKRMLIIACILLICLFALLYIHEYTSRPAKKNPVRKEQPSTPRKRQPARKEAPAAGSSRFIPPHAEIPVLHSGEKEEIVRHEGYTVSFNPDYKIANWVAYELTGREVKSRKSERSDKFMPDPALKGKTALNDDYTRSGYDRGHLAPAGDMKWSARAMQESFYLSNIVPQHPKLNRGIWKDLEERIRDWAVADSALLIATGPIIRKHLKRIGKSGVAVPDSMYKVIISPYGKEPEGIAFLFANKDYGRVPLSSLAVPVDSVEKITGIDFFPTLPDGVERKTESTVNLKKWNLN